MDKDEARQIALDKARELRRLSWSALRERYLDRPETVEVSGPSEIVYQVETQAFWDSAKEGDLRVRVAIDDAGWRAFMPLSEDFIIAPDGSFVGE